MGEDSDNQRGILDGGKDLQVAAAVWTVFNVDLEDALEQTRPTHAAWRRAMRSVSSVMGVDGLAWDDLGP